MVVKTERERERERVDRKAVEFIDNKHHSRIHIQALSFICQYRLVAKFFSQYSFVPGVVTLLLQLQASWCIQCKEHEAVYFKLHSGLVW